MRMTQDSPKLVVVIDDDPATLDGMSGLLESWGYAVVAAPSQDTALKRLGAHGQGPDLIVSDYRLAEGKLGTQAIEHLRKAFAIPGFEIPALLITGDHISPHDRERCAGHYQLMRKPADTTALRAMLKQMVQDGTRCAEH
jgi:CheY-like chemotaxis protein